MRRRPGQGKGKRHGRDKKSKYGMKVKAFEKGGTGKRPRNVQRKIKKQ